jgi:hypothetical protein
MTPPVQRQWTDVERPRMRLARSIVSNGYIPLPPKEDYNSPQGVPRAVVLWADPGTGTRFGKRDL